MNNFVEVLIVFVVVMVFAGPVGFVRYRLYSRFVQSQESIAESLRKIAEGQTKSHS
jgi:hypothetical protein